MLFGGLTVCRRGCFGELALKEIAPNCTLWREGPFRSQLFRGGKFIPRTGEVSFEKKRAAQICVEPGVRLHFEAAPPQLRSPSVVPSVEEKNRRGAQEVVIVGRVHKHVFISPQHAVRTRAAQIRDILAGKGLCIISILYKEISQFLCRGGDDCNIRVAPCMHHFLEAIRLVLAYPRRIEQRDAQEVLLRPEAAWQVRGDQAQSIVPAYLGLPFRVFFKVCIKKQFVSRAYQPDVVSSDLWFLVRFRFSRPEFHRVKARPMSACLPANLPVQPFLLLFSGLVYVGRNPFPFDAWLRYRLCKFLWGVERLQTHRRSTACQQSGKCQGPD